jgi:hypothetical protein
MGVDLSALASDPHVLAMLAIVERTRSHQVRSDWGLLKPPRPADIPALGQGMRVFAPTWFALEWMLPPQRDRAAVVGAAAEALRRSLEQRSSPADALARALEALGEFNEWSSHIHLFWRGFGYPLDKGPFADRIKRVIDFSGSTPRIHEAAANAELSLQSSPE